MKVNVSLAWSPHDPTITVNRDDSTIQVSVDAALSAQQVYRACSAMPDVGGEIFAQWCALVGFDPLRIDVMNDKDSVSEFPPEPAK